MAESFLSFDCMSIFSVLEKELHDRFKQMLVVRMYFGESNAAAISTEDIRYLALRLGITNSDITRTRLVCYVSKNLIEKGLVRINGHYICENNVEIVQTVQ